MTCPVGVQTDQDPWPVARVTALEYVLIVAALLIAFAAAFQTVTAPFEPEPAALGPADGAVTAPAPTTQPAVRSTGPATHL